MDELAARYRRISNAVRPATLIAVSKKQPVERIEALYHLGHRDFGENYVQELVDKAEFLKRHECGNVNWHFIGKLQSNKVKYIASFVSVVHGLDSEKLAGELSKRWKKARREGCLPVFIQVNIDLEDSKGGVPPQDVAALAKAVKRHPELDLRGLMCIPSAEGDPAGAFRRMRELIGELGDLTAGELSMGMSNDYREALKEGSTYVRVGSALFGPREG